MLVFSGAYAIENIKNPKKNDMLLFTIVFVGYFIVYLFTEANPRYRYLSALCMLVLSSGYYKQIKEWFSHGKSTLL